MFLELVWIDLRSGWPATEWRNGEIQKIAGEGAGKSAANIRGVLEGVLARVLRGERAQGKAPLEAPSPALPPAPRMFAALFPAPSPAIFWISPFLYSVAGHPDLKDRLYVRGVFVRMPTRDLQQAQEAEHLGLVKDSRECNRHQMAADPEALLQELTSEI